MTNLSRSLQIFFWAYAFIYVVSCSLSITQVDLWWQLSEGMRILHSWTLPTAPVAAFGIPADPYFDEYAGYEVVLATLFKIGGFPALWIIFAAIYLAIVFLPISTSTQKYPAFDFSSTLAMLFAGILMKQRLEQRPELVGGLLLVLLMVILRRSKLEEIPRRTLVALFFLFVVWTNTHSSFIIGLFVMGQWMLCEYIMKYRRFALPDFFPGALAMGFAALVGAMVNPYGPRRLAFPFMQGFDPGSTALSPEMWPITDFTSVAGILATISIVLLVWGILTTRGVPLWLMLFSLFAVIVSLRSFRFINILAIAVLFVYASRAESVALQKPKMPSRWLSLSKDVALCLLCVVTIFGGAFSYLFTYDEMRGEKQLAAHTIRFAPDISSVREEPGNGRIPALCGHGIGSYVSFGDNSQFSPILDSGLAHFSGDTKRYFYFVWEKPEALELALLQLKIDYVLVDRETVPWAATMARLPGWKLVTCDTYGLLWARSDGSTTLSPTMRTQVEACVELILQRGETISAFYYSTLLDDPVRSLNIIETYGGKAWREWTFTYFDAWIHTLPVTVIEKYLASEHPHQYPLIDAMLAARLGPDHFEKYAATNPAGPRSWYWDAVEARSALEKGDKSRAKAILDSIQPAPISSVTYYELWNEANGGDLSELNKYGRWQTWNPEAKEFMGGVSSQLNRRITELNGR